MRTPTLEEETSELLNVITIGQRFGGGIRVFLPLQRLYAMRAAYWVRKITLPCASLEDQVPCTITSGATMEPPFEEMYQAYRGLLAAYRSEDRIALVNALRGMRIVEFCPDLNGQLERMEYLTTQGAPHVRLILHVELALFAHELEDEVKVESHAGQAWALDPLGWERYILCTLMGVFAASSGRVQEAIHWLDDSASACFENEKILLECGLRPPNLYLAQKLLSLGHRIPVVDYLLTCQDIWRLKSMPFAEWVHQIESGQDPDFESSEIIREMSRPFHRLDLQSRRAFDPRSASPLNSSHGIKESRARVLLARERRLAEAKRTLDMMTPGSPPMDQQE
jgi:hypothetical protein